MNIIEVLNYVNVICIWAFALMLLWVISRMRYSFYKCLIRLFYHRNTDYFNWLMRHKYYIYSFVVFLACIGMSVGLLSQAYEGVIKIKTEYIITVSICFWCFLSPLILSLFITAYKNENT